VLAVDEEPVVLGFLRLALEADDLQVDTACSVLAAFNIVQQHEPDLVLLDVFMRNGSGLQLCKKIRANTQTKCIQIILLTVAQEPFVSRCVADVGADGCIRITPNTVAVRSKIRRILNLAEVPCPSVPMESVAVEVPALRENAYVEPGVQAGFTYQAQAGSPHQPRRTTEG